MKIFYALAAAAIILFSAGCEDSRKDTDTLVMVTEAIFPPYDFYVGPDIAGLDVDIVRLVAQKLGKKLRIVDTQFNSLISLVSEGEADIAASGITVTPERKRKVLFSIPYEVATQRIVVPVKSWITRPDDLKKEGTRICCKISTTGHEFVQQNFSEDRIIYYENLDLILNALQNGKADVAVLDDGMASSLAEKYPTQVRLLDIPLTREEYAIAVNKKNQALCDTFNDVIAELQRSGELQKMKKKNQELASRKK